MRKLLKKLTKKDFVLIVILFIVAVMCFLNTFDIVKLSESQSNYVATIFTIIVFISLIRINKKDKHDQ
ncbi:hypothetical protein ACQKKI_05165 [Staphylococcus capitis]|uniref:hypothetical protein n=1 Tax=Staphylococcus TaxID=1279 RepID=UPI0001929316|nr:hypothetical protein [Staphylococcus capitis]EEE48574.1 hypothetical protein STACA0001_1848 [Staphylococcus capitis SK14]EGS40398.1 hypothetical protein SEVCU116_1153 [Staphylococcus capitis VCU116]MBN6785352.1 hypothetical protein [Staphylococcus capitis]MCT2014193.1 hypothetical protein [Staphylococcus capitis]MEB5629318.1 hypothetical protein [Staphylococcus capitis]